MEYSARDFTVTLPVDEYIKRFHRPDHFIKMCRECGNYGRSWGCPPFSHDTEKELRKYRRVTLTATKMIPRRKDIPLSDVFAFMRTERRRIDGKMLALEQKTGGRYFAFSGTCIYCPEGTCARITDQPCRHPDLVRPSLESYGFDMERTATELFGEELKWSKDGFIPEYLILISGFFHNEEEIMAAD